MTGLNEQTEVKQIKVINNLTGEVTEVEIESAEQAKNLYLELAASATAIDKAKKQILGYLDDFLGQDDEYQFGDGKRLRRKQREIKRWTTGALRHVGIDIDTIDVISVVNMTAAKELVSDLMERGDIKPDSGKYLNENAEVSYSAPFVEIR